MGERIARHDWAATLLGPIESWEPSIRNAVTLTVRCAFPMLVFVGPDLIQIYNDAAIPLMVGKHPDASFALPWSVAWAEVADELLPRLHDVARTGRSLLVENTAFPLVRHGRPEDTYVTFSYTALYADDGEISGVHCAVLETTEIVLAARRLAIVHQISTAAADGAFDDIARNVADVLARHPSDVPFGAIYRLDEVGSIARRVTTFGTRDGVHFPPLVEADGVEAPWKPLFDPDGAMFTVSDIAFLPIVGAHGALTGMLVAGRGPRVRWTTEYHRFFDAIAFELSSAMRLATAREFASQVLAREARASKSFQDASLPSSLPLASGVIFDAIYVPASDEARVGGDWYDAVRLHDGRVVVSIGDVAGHGLLAAVTMGNIRQIIRGIAQVHADPALMLDAADRALRLEHPDVFVTAFVGVIDLVKKTLTFASAGHPPPLVRHANGAVDELPFGGLPLGLRGAASDVSRTVALPEACTLLLYTDGLTEASRDVTAGDIAVRAALSRVDVASAAAHAIYATVIGERRLDDDVAILTVGIARTTDDDDAGSDLTRIERRRRR